MDRHTENGFNADELKEIAHAVKCEIKFRTDEISIWTTDNNLLIMFPGMTYGFLRGNVRVTVNFFGALMIESDELKLTVTG